MKVIGKETTLNVLVGADPELFIMGKKTKKFKSAHGRVPGTKANPHPVPCGAIQIDGMALEFNIDPAATKTEFKRNLKTVMGELKARVPQFHVMAVPTATFDKKHLAKQPPEALELGCEPDYCAYFDGPNPRPNAAADFRTGSGHVHIGWTKDVDIHDPEHIEACRILVRELDFRLGLPSLLWDNDGKRRELYGKAGAYRIKPYGVEYRTLSNRWLSSPKLQEFVFNQVVASVEALLTLKKEDRMQELYAQDRARRAINQGDIRYARDFCTYWKITPPVVKEKYNV
ncbi:MAG: putative amidoligase domain-containing protein [Aeromonas sp.]